MRRGLGEIDVTFRQDVELPLFFCIYGHLNFPNLLQIPNAGGFVKIKPSCLASSVLDPAKNRSAKNSHRRNSDAD